MIASSKFIEFATRKWWENLSSQEQNFQQWSSVLVHARTSTRSWLQTATSTGETMVRMVLMMLSIPSITLFSGFWQTTTLQSGDLHRVDKPNSKRQNALLQFWMDTILSESLPPKWCTIKSNTSRDKWGAPMIGAVVLRQVLVWRRLTHSHSMKRWGTKYFYVCFNNPSNGKKVTHKIWLTIYL